MTAPTAAALTHRAGWTVYSGAGLAMVAFAANSLLTRSALDSASIDAATFTTVRLVAGAAALTVILAAKARAAPRVLARPAPWRTAGLLFAYAAAFSLAYLRIGAAAGALVLFGTVQTVMYGAALRRGDHIGASGWWGLVLAAAGLIALVAPGVSSPDLAGVALMMLAGAAWAGYTLAGRSTTDPIAASARNFVWAVPLVVALELATALVRPASLHASAHGVALAIASGAVASGMGYALWYSVLPRLTRVQSGIIQMAPPPLAAVGGLLLLGEAIGARVLLSSCLILTGVAVGVLGGRRR